MPSWNRLLYSEQIEMEIRRLANEQAIHCDTLERISMREYERSKRLGHLVLDLQKRVIELERKLNA